MKKLHLIGFVSLVVFAFGTITASAAFAESEWLWEKEAITIKLAAETESEISLKDDGTGTTVLCSVTFVGTIGPGPADEITEVDDLSLAKDSTTNLAGAIVPAVSCVIVEKGLCTEANGSLMWVMPTKLPWVTKIVLDEGIFIDELPNNAGFEFSCNTIVGRQTDACMGKYGADLTNEVGGVLIEFLNDELTNPAGSCSIGGEKGWLLISDGPGLTFHPNGGTIEVS